VKKEKRHVEKEKEEAVYKRGWNQVSRQDIIANSLGLNSHRKEQAMQERTAPYEQGYWKEGLLSTESDIATSGSSLSDQIRSAAD
jgi:hypothetical protein